MQVDSIATKDSSETTDGDIRELLNAPSEDEKPLVDPDIFEQQQPNQPIYKSIPLKSGVAAVLSLILIVPTLALFTGGLLSRGSDNSEEAKVEEPGTDETEEQRALRLAEEENASLKKDLALQSQSFTAEEVSQLDNTSEQSTTPSSSNKPSTATRSSPPSAVRTSQPQSVAVARPAATSRTAPRPPARTSRPSTIQPLPAPRPSVVQNASAPRFSATPQSINLSEIAAAGNYGELPSPDIPIQATSQVGQAYARTSQLGSAMYSAASNTIPVSVSDRSTTPSAVSASLPSTDSRSIRPLPTVMQSVEEIASPSTKNNEITTGPELLADVETQGSYEAERALIMNGAESDSFYNSVDASVLLPGSTASAEVKNALTWADDLPRAEGSVVLTSPLISNNLEFLPTGTELIVQIGDLSESGAVVLHVVSIVLPNDAPITEVDLPGDAVAILNIDGGYPVAEAERSSERQLRSIDREQALLGAASSAGRFLNRPERETNVFGVSGSSSSRESGSGSLWGSLLEGAANGMLSSRSNRLEGEADELRDRPTIWTLKPGKELQIFITREVAL